MSRLRRARPGRPPRCTSCGDTKWIDAIDNDGESYKGCANCVIWLAPTTQRAVRLRAGGSITITASIDVLSMSAADRAFVEGLLAAMDAYELNNPPSYLDEMMASLAAKPQAEPSDEPFPQALIDALMEDEP